MKEWRRLFDGFGQMGVENIGKIIEHPQTIRGASNDSSGKDHRHRYDRYDWWSIGDGFKAPTRFFGVHDVLGDVSCIIFEFPTRTY